MTSTDSDSIPPCPTCDSILVREMGMLYRCAQCRRIFAVSGGVAEPMGGPNLSSQDDGRAEVALRRRGLL